jgi:photosystem I subunit 2
MSSLTAFTSKARCAGARGSSRQFARRQRVVRVSAEGVPAKKPAKKAKKEEAPWVQPKLDPSMPSPIFGGSTGGLLRKAQVEEFYVITWDSKKEQIFEMPTGGAAIMREGPNLLKLARKEQCHALLSQLRTKFKLNGCYYRVFPNGEVQYLHPKDGVYPEKVNQGRQQSNCNDRRIGQNVNPIQVKFTGSLGPFDSDKKE